MAVRTIEQIREARQRMATTLHENLTNAVENKRPPKDVAVKRLERMMARDTERIEEARKAKEKVAERFESEIVRRELRLVELNKQLEEQKKGLVTPSREEPVGKKKLRPGLIPGLGVKSIKRLADGGVLTLEDLAKAKRAFLVQTLETSPGKANGFIAAAGKLIRDSG